MHPRQLTKQRDKAYLSLSLLLLLPSLCFPAVLKGEIAINIDLYCSSIYMEVFREISSPSPLATPSSSTATETRAPLELEHMFDKVVTPSDVGKLNRLVIPKQHAEKYFPLDPASADKGVLLCFLESGVATGGASSGKQWQFRYSYWNSSQSYVMTKGWSRYVKDKQLDSGDTVSFSRSSGGQLFIDCQRQRQQQLLRRNPLQVARWARFFSPNVRPPGFSVYGGAMWCSYLQAAAPVANPDNREPMGGEALRAPMVPEMVSIPDHTAEPKRVRLFGVDLECADVDSSTTPVPDLQLVAAPKPPLPSIEGKEKVEEQESGSR